MIRLTVARLILLGSGKIDLETFIAINTGNHKLKIPALAYPQGLHLTNIEYPYLSIKPKTSIDLL
jgi:tRNA U38,U39,U40 pseudouridine synthase TruA